MKIITSLRRCIAALCFVLLSCLSIQGFAAPLPAPNYLSPMDHIGIIVKDADQEAANLAVRFDGKITSKKILRFNHAQYQGKELSYTAYFVFVKVGNSTVEFIQPDPSVPSPYLDILKEKGPQAHHICFVMKSREDIVRQLAMVPDAKIIVSAHAGTGQGGDMVYVEGLIPGILVELATPIK